MKRICILIAVVTFVAMGLSGCFSNEVEIRVFTDSTGVQWRILFEAEDGNQLIITEYVHGLTQYNSVNVYTFLGQSDRLRPALDTWFANTLAPELREVALVAENVNNDVRLTAEGDVEKFYAEVVHENETAGWSVAGGTASQESPLFILSISEVNKYVTLGTLNMQGMVYLIEHDLYVPASWWLRSPGSNVKSPVAIMSAGDTDGARITAVPATEKYGFRPALWITRSR
jgi:hypothetical protein